MKICIWTGSIFKLGGTKRVVTVVVNKLIENHDITIMTYDSPKIENREMYGLDERVTIDYIDSDHFKDNKKTISRFYRSILKKINNDTGMLNKKRCNNTLSNAFYPKHIRDKWTEHINAKDYDIIVATAGFSLLLAMIADNIRAKTVGWQHNCYDAYINQKGILFWKKEEILKEYFPKLDAFLVLNSYDQQEYAEKLNIECKVMENPRSFTSDVKTDISQKRFFVAARFVEAKGLDLLISSFKQFCEVNSDWELVIAGDGPLRNQVIQSVWKAHLTERVKFIGVTDDVIKYYLQSSIYLLSSKWEGWGLVVIEAFEMGMPVVAYDIVPIDLLITNGEDGFIIDKFDTDKFAGIMVKLAEDDELRKTMGEKAIEKAKRFSVEKICEVWEEMFHTI